MVSLIVVIIMLLLSAFFSGMEIAYVTSNKLKLELATKDVSFGSRLLAIVTDNSSQYISTMLVGNNLVNVIYSIFLAKLLEAPLQPIGNDFVILLLQTIIATLVVLTFAEFLPKTLFRVLSNSALKTFVYPVAFFYFIFYPIVMFMMWITQAIVKIFGISITKQQKDKIFGKVDIEDIIEQSTDDDETSNSAQELKIFQNAMDFSSIKLRECIVPRNNILALPQEATIDELKAKFIETGHSNILIYKDTVDSVVGYVNFKDIFKNPSSLGEIMRRILVVPETMSAKKLFQQLMANGKSIAVVVDEFGSTCGLVTVEDILEEIFGEFEDEHDVPERSVVINKDGNYVISGMADVETLNEDYDLSLTESDEYETIAGYIMYFSGNFPQNGEFVSIEDGDKTFRFKILDIQGTKIEKVMLFANN